MEWKCNICNEEHGEVPLCFGSVAPCYAMVPQDEWIARVQLTADHCIVDEEHFFARGHIEIPILGHPEPFAFSVWSSLSEASFEHMSDRWDAPDRQTDPPYFGWLCSSLPLYPSTLSLRLSVQSRSPGLIPVFYLEPSDHPLALEQKQGITIARWHQIAQELLKPAQG